MAQQTAVEWLIEQVNSEQYQIAFGQTYISIDLIEQAKQMEKEQIENARPQITPNCVTKEISDEEIDKVSLKVGYVHRDNVMAFQTGAKWYREQLKKP